MVNTHPYLSLNQISTGPLTWPLSPKPGLYIFSADVYFSIKASTSCWNEQRDGIRSLSLQFSLTLFDFFFLIKITHPLFTPMSSPPALPALTSSLSSPTALSSVETASAKQLALQTAVYLLIALGIVICYLSPCAIIGPPSHHPYLLSIYQQSLSPSSAARSCSCGTTIGQSSADI